MHNINDYKLAYLKYPKILAEIFYHNLPLDVIIERFIEFAHYDYDTEYFIPCIKPIITGIIKSNDWSWVDENILKDFSGLSFEALVANEKYYLTKKQDSNEALFIWVAYLSFCDQDPNLGIDNAFDEISCYALRSKNLQLLYFLSLATFDFIVSSPWGSFSKALFTHILVCLAANMNPSVKVAVEIKMSQENSKFIKELFDHWELYFESNIPNWSSLASEYGFNKYDLFEKQVEDIEAWILQEFKGKI